MLNALMVLDLGVLQRKDQLNIMEGGGWSSLRTMQVWYLWYPKFCVLLQEVV